MTIIVTRAHIVAATRLLPQETYCCHALAVVLAGGTHYRDTTPESRDAADAFLHPFLEQEGISNTGTWLMINKNVKLGPQEDDKFVEDDDDRKLLDKDGKAMKVAISREQFLARVHDSLPPLTAADIQVTRADIVELRRRIYAEECRFICNGLKHVVAQRLGIHYSQCWKVLDFIHPLLDRDGISTSGTWAGATCSRVEWLDDLLLEMPA